MTSLATLLEQQTVIVCVGAGGVGKTTTAAALALEAARRGRRVCVVTIDPARRLSDAMGFDPDRAIGNEPQQIDFAAKGELWAVMLDTSTTFDALIRTYAPSEEQAQNILTNDFYRNIADSMSGAHEYMAMEKLYELHNDERFDLVVVDTPPTSNAIDFLEAPDRITSFLDHRLYKILVTPTGGLARVVNFAAQGFLRTVARIVSASVVDDAIEFFATFDGMEEGFRGRAVAVHDLLIADDTGFVLVTVPRNDTVDDAATFIKTLADADIAVDAIVVNRVHPFFGSERLDELGDGPLAPFITVLHESQTVAMGQDAVLAALTDEVPAGAVVKIPFLDTDVHDLDGPPSCSPPTPIGSSKKSMPLWPMIRPTSTESEQASMCFRPSPS
jgi:anion-transporting  ArsA/GET3 family ATPase